MTRLVLVILATGAALLGAPLAASAASNVLVDAAASPASGTTETAFRLEVRYAGRLPARTVAVAVAGRTVSMDRVAGSATSGTWATTLRLPAGSWVATFRAGTERGDDPVLTGPTITVMSASSPTPGSTPQPIPQPTPSTPPSSPRPSGGAEGPGGPGRENHAPQITPAAGPTDMASEPAEPPDGSGSTPGTADASRGAASTTGTPAPSGGAGAVRSHDSGPAPSGGGPTSLALPSGTGAPAPPMGEPPVRGGPPARPASSGGAPTLADPSGEPGADAARLSDDVLLASTRVAAAWLAALLAAIAVALAVLARRRRQDAAHAEAAMAAAEADRILRLRTVRAARRRLDEQDPMLAAEERRRLERRGRRPD